MHHIESFHIDSDHNKSPLIKSVHLISNPFISIHFTTLHIASDNFKSIHLTLLQIKSFPFTLHWVTLLHITLNHITLTHITYHITYQFTAYHITSLHITLYHITSHQIAIVSQPSKCLKFMTFREGCFVIRNWMQVLKWNSWDFLPPLILQKLNEDNQVSQLGDYDAPFCEQQYTRGTCYISLFKFKSFDKFNTPWTASNFRHLLSCGTIHFTSLNVILYHFARLHFPSLKMISLQITLLYITSLHFTLHDLT